MKKHLTSNYFEQCKAVFTVGTTGIWHMANIGSIISAPLALVTLDAV